MIHFRAIPDLKSIVGLHLNLKMQIHIKHENIWLDLELVNISS